jgi:hypothetical protein
MAPVASRHMHGSRQEKVGPRPDSLRAPRRRRSLPSPLPVRVATTVKSLIICAVLRMATSEASLLPATPATPARAPSCQAAARRWCTRLWTSAQAAMWPSRCAAAGSTDIGKDEGWGRSGSRLVRRNLCGKVHPRADSLHCSPPLQLRAMHSSHSPALHDLLVSARRSAIGHAGPGPGAAQGGEARGAALGEGEPTSARRRAADARAATWRENPQGLGQSPTRLLCMHVPPPLSARGCADHIQLGCEPRQHRAAAGRVRRGPPGRRRRRSRRRRRPGQGGGAAAGHCGGCRGWGREGGRARLHAAHCGSQPRLHPPLPLSPVGAHPGPRPAGPAQRVRGAHARAHGRLLLHASGAGAPRARGPQDTGKKDMGLGMWLGRPRTAPAHWLCAPRPPFAPRPPRPQLRGLLFMHANGFWCAAAWRARGATWRCRDPRGLRGVRPLCTPAHTAPPEVPKSLPPPPLPAKQPPRPQARELHGAAGKPSAQGVVRRSVVWWDVVLC